MGVRQRRSQSQHGDVDGGANKREDLMGYIVWDSMLGKIIQLTGVGLMSTIMLAHFMT